MSLAKKLLDDVVAAGDSVAAIEMSPGFHILLIEEMMTAQTGPGADFLSDINQRFGGLPIIFMHGGPDYCCLLNSEQYLLRKNYINLLKIYNDKYKSLNIFISKSYKMENPLLTQINHLNELKSLVKRMDILDEQITKVGKM